MSAISSQSDTYAYKQIILNKNRRAQLYNASPNSSLDHRAHLKLEHTWHTRGRQREWEMDIEFQMLLLSSTAGYLSISILINQ